MSQLSVTESISASSSLSVILVSLSSCLSLMLSTGVTELFMEFGCDLVLFFNSFLVEMVNG